MNGRIFTLLTGLLSMIVVGAGTAQAAPAGGSGANNPGQQAKTLQESILSRYADGKYQETIELLKDFIPKFPTNENIPANLNRLAHCYARTEQWDKFDAPLDECIKRFPGSRHWFFAYAQKLNRLKNLKDADKYLAAVDAMIRKNGEVPTTLGIPRFIDPHGGPVDLSNPFNHWPAYFLAASPMHPLPLPHDWWMDVLAVCQTPEHSAQALRTFQKLFSKKPHEIPLEWQLAHVVLLDRNGEKELAQKVLNDYMKPLEDTYKDFRVISLLARRAEFARQAKDAQTVEAIFQKLLKDYSACRTLAEPLYLHIMEIGRSPERYGAFAALTKQYVQSFPYSVDPLNAGSFRWMGLLNEWIKIAATTSLQGNQRPASDLLALIEELEKGKSPYIGPKVSLWWKYQLLMMQARFPDAARIAEQIVSDPNWSPAGFRMLVEDAPKHESITALLAATRQKRGIPVKDPASPAAEMLEKVRGHLKEGRERMAEEVAGEMWTKHKTDAHTIEAVAEMAAYYFQRVLAEPLDKWANRMVEAYPQHPLTHNVLANQSDAENGRRDFVRMGAVLDTAMARFPGSDGRWDNDWENQRVAAYIARQDMAGGTAFVRQRHAQRIEAGDAPALVSVHWRLINGGLASITQKQAGDEWVAMGKRVAGTPMELYCNLRAYWHYYDQVYYQRPEIQWDGALTAARFLRNQTMDPDLSWQTQFLESNILAWKGDAPALAKALADGLKDGNQRDLYLRLDVNTTGTTLGKLPRPEDGAGLARRLASLCVTPTDHAAVTMLQACFWQAAGKSPQASQCYLAVAYSTGNPATMFPVFQWGLNGLTSEPQQYKAEVQRVVRTSPQAQDVIPEILFSWWHQVPESQTMARKTLLEKYPASSFRDTLEDEISEAQKSKPPQKKN